MFIQDSETTGPAHSVWIGNRSGHELLAVTDLDGDGGDDLLFRRISDGFLYGRSGDDNSHLGTWGTHKRGEELQAVADFDNDGRVDMLWERSDGRMFIQDSETTGPAHSVWIGNQSGHELLAVTDTFFSEGLLI